MSLCLLIKLYRLCLGLYPRTFQELFSAEMEQVFAQRIAEAAGRGRVALLWTTLVELAGAAWEGPLERARAREKIRCMRQNRAGHNLGAG